VFTIETVFIFLIGIGALVLVGAIIVLAVKTTREEVTTDSKEHEKKTEYEAWYNRRKEDIPQRYRLPVELLISLAKRASVRQKVMNYVLVATDFENAQTKGADNIFERYVDIMQERMENDVDNKSKGYKKLDEPYVVELMILKEEAFVIGKYNQSVLTVKDFKGKTFNVLAKETHYPKRSNGNKPAKKDNYIKVNPRTVRLERGTKELKLLGVAPDGHLVTKASDGRVDHHPKEKLVDVNTDKTPTLVPAKSTKAYYKKLIKELRKSNIITETDLSALNRIFDQYSE